MGIQLLADHKPPPIQLANPKKFLQLKGSMKELKMFHIYETEKITPKDSDVAEYNVLFGSSARDRHARCI